MGYFCDYGKYTQLSEFERILVIFAIFFSGIWDTFQNIYRDMGYQGPTLFQGITVNH